MDEISALIVVVTLVMIISIIGFLAFYDTPKTDTSKTYIITSAKWAKTSERSIQIDVTDVVKAILNPSTGILLCPGGFYTMVDDPAPWHAKTLTVYYTLNGVAAQFNWSEGVDGANDIGYLQL
jgi:hypothetical protein